jgi:acetyl-CoA acetyltransferase
VFAVASGFYDIVLVGGLEDMSKRTTEDVAEGLALAASPYEIRPASPSPGFSVRSPRRTSPSMVPAAST